MKNKLKILSLGTDRSALDKDSKLAERLVEYGELVGKYSVVVPSIEKKKITLSGSVEVYGSGGKNKFKQLQRIFDQASEILSSEQYDIISVQDQYYIAFVAWLLARKYQLGLEIQNHGWERHSGLRKRLAKFLLPRADAVRTVSERLKKQIHNEYKVPLERINVVRIFVDANTNSRELDTNSHELPKGDKLVFLTVGRLVPVKNIGLQIRAMAEILKSTNSRESDTNGHEFSTNGHKQIELWVVGDGPEKKKLEVRSKRLEVNENIKFLGWMEHDKLLDLYGQADCLVLTSHAEGWPTVITEAAARGLPIIMTDVGSAGDLIIDNESGIIIPVNDKAALVKAMLNIIKNSGLKERLGQGALKAVKKLPNKAETLNLYLKSWEQAAKKENDI